MKARLSPIVLSLVLGFALPATSAIAAESPPKIESESVSNVGRGDATLEASINPGGLETSYEFIFAERLWCEKSTPACEPPIEFISLPGGQLPASYEAQHVTLDLNSVGVFVGFPDFYDFVTVATNSAGTDWGSGVEFFPPPFTPEEEPEPPVEPPEEEPGASEEPPEEEPAGSPEEPGAPEEEPEPPVEPPEEEPGASEEPGAPEEEPEAKEPPSHVGSPGAPQGEEAGSPPPPPTEGATQGPAKAKSCHRASHRRHRKHHRAGIGKGCHPS